MLINPLLYEELTQPQNIHVHTQKLKTCKTFPNIKEFSKCSGLLSSCSQYSQENLHSTNWKPVSNFPSTQELQCDQCLHVTFTMNQQYLWPGTAALHIFPVLTIVSGNHNLGMPGTSLTNSALLPNGYQESTVPGQAGTRVTLYCTASLIYNRVG
jgi:hypothetical protein